MVVNAKKQNKIGWSKEYNAQIVGDCIVLNRRSKRYNTPKENIVVDITQVNWLMQYRINGLYATVCIYVYLFVV